MSRLSPRSTRSSTRFPHSTLFRSQYHGWYVAWWLFAPAAIVRAVWTSASPALITNQVLTTPAAESLPAFGFERGAILSDARSVAQGQQIGRASCRERGCQYV